MVSDVFDCHGNSGVLPRAVYVVAKRVVLKDIGSSEKKTLLQNENHLQQRFFISAFGMGNN